VRGHLFYAGENPPYIPKRPDIVRAKLINGGLINYYLKSKPAGEVVFEISDVTGRFKRELKITGKPGINRLTWDLRFDPTAEQIKQTIQQMERLLERLPQMTTLNRDQRESVNQMKMDIKSAKNMRDINRLRNRLVNRFRDVGSLRRSFPTRMQRSSAQPGEYLIKMTVDGKIYSNKITVRKDPMLN